MAIFKTNISECRSDGEKKVANFFADKLNNEYLIWTNVYLIISSYGQTEEVEADLIIFHYDIGFIVFEIKDWRIEQIEDITMDKVYVNGKKETNPYKKARNAHYVLRDKLKARRELCNDLGLGTPVNFGVILPYISKEEFQKKLRALNTNHNDVGLPSNKLLCAEEFLDNSIFNNKDSAKNKLCNLRDKRLKFLVTFPRELLWIFDDVLGAPDDEDSLVDKIQKDCRGFSGESVFVLDEKQKAIAAQYLKNMYSNPGPMLIEGVAGTGKTVIIQAMFEQIARDPSKTIAYITKHNELVDDFKRTIEQLDLDVNNPSYTIMTFDKFLFKEISEVTLDGKMILVEELKQLPRNENSWYEDFPYNNFIDGVSNVVGGKFDFIFIDEGHNLSNEALKFLVRSSKGKKRGEEGNIIYTHDPEQQVYDIERKFREAELTFKHKYVLELNYRNTVEISEFALKISNKYSKILSEYHRLSTNRHGSMPEVFFNSDYLECANSLFKKYSQWLAEGFQPHEIALIYPQADCDVPESLLWVILDKFVEQNIAISWHYSQNDINQMLRNVRPSWVEERRIITRRGANTAETENKLNLITGYSSQGRTYKCSIVIMDHAQLKSRFPGKENNLLYIMLTRSVDNLSLAFVEDTEYYKKSNEIIESMKNSKR
ncbi:MAG: NERD domain-containing protein [Candidatus Omnitrophica bacterium]|nr:NERD domain-containing protein [Candidatus Omnitrophota bacterium]